VKIFLQNRETSYLPEKRDSFLYHLLHQAYSQVNYLTWPWPGGGQKRVAIYVHTLRIYRGKEQPIFEMNIESKSLSIFSTHMGAVGRAITNRLGL